MNRLTCLLLVSALGAGPALAQDDSLPTRLSPLARAQIVRLADSLKANGLPSDVVYSKAREGVLRGVDDQRILLAVRAVAARIGVARDALGDGASRDELVSGADAISAGIEPSTLRRIAKAAPADDGRALATALIVLTDLVKRGVPPSVATETVHSLALRGAGAEAFLGFRLNVERAIRDGRSPADAATVTGEAALGRPVPPRVRPPVRSP